MSSTNRFTILDPDITIKPVKLSNTTLNNLSTTVSNSDKKFIRKNISDDFSDNLSNDSPDENFQTNNYFHDNLNNSENNSNSNKKWRRLDLDSEMKYKSFNSFSNFNNQKKLKTAVREVKNKKKLLCNNVITTGSCCYENKCMYAHSLSEQQIDSNRKLAYDILFSTSDLSNINFKENVALYRSLRDLTKICDKEHCTGGYNCKHGVCGNKKYCVCVKDLDYGDCINQNCEFIHLTLRGLEPFYSGYAIKQDKHIPGTLLTADFINRLPKNDEDIMDELSDISVDSNSDDTIDECEQSIFEDSIINHK